MLSISRILALLAGTLIGAMVVRRKENSNADDKPWRTDLDVLAARLAEFQPKLEALTAQLAVRADGRIEDLAARLSRLQPEMEAQAVDLPLKLDVRIGDLAAQLAKVQPGIEAWTAETAPKFDARVDDLAARLAAVESKADSNQDKVVDLQQKLSAHDLKLQATNQVVMAIEQVLTSRMAEIDNHIEAQGRTLEAMNTSIAQSDELLERVLDLVQNLSRAAAEPRESVSIAPGGRGNP